MERSLEALLSAREAGVLGHPLCLRGVRGIQPTCGRWESRPQRDHPAVVHPRGPAGPRMRQELVAVRGCSTHLTGGRGK